ncbi:hypothetical protein ER308_15485 [Egibacter rhizosphaerae]|uniref:Rhamnosyl transferase n=1 Tax=Egibacter rhizosphaerae TaxID=1670831 RepID=A0A411YHZ0_9ACTN|nr:glycosyltransferase [Egibacter rhizosphaerae]QBI20833.1 hypothetical protein ER308_15485 [Egibacter rhizosphaerae]
MDTTNPAASSFVHAFVRYSILSARNEGGWSGARQDGDLETYRQRLFDPQRLAVHAHLFENVTLPSIAEQTVEVGASWFRLTVLTSTELPESHRDRLHAALAPLGWAELREVSPTQDPSKVVTEAIEPLTGRDVYATLRIDDDDGLARTFMAQLAPYLTPAWAGYAAAFPSGAAGLLDQHGNGFEEVRHARWPYSSIGLTYVAAAGNAPYSHVFQLGPHRRVDERIPLVTDGRECAWIRSIHWAQEQSYTRGLEKHRRQYSRGEPIAASEVRERFPITIACGP